MELMGNVEKKQTDYITLKLQDDIKRRLNDAMLKALLREKKLTIMRDFVFVTYMFKTK